MRGMRTSAPTGLRQTIISWLSLMVALFSFAQPAFPQSAPPSAHSRPLAVALTHVRVVDVRTGTLHAGQTIVIQQNKIAAVGPSKEIRIPAKAKQVDCKGLFAIPGLWDMHVHLVFGDWFPGGKEISLPMFVANGVTGVRDMGSDLEPVQNWRSEIAAGKLIGPRIYTPGPMLDGPRPRFPSSVAIATPEDGRRAVDDLRRRGADFIKLQSLIPRDAVFAISDEAKKQGIPFAGHVPDAVRASEMSDAGMKSFEHLIGIFEGSSPSEDDFLQGGKTEAKFLASFEPARAETLSLHLANRHTWQCPTLVWERGGNLLDVTDFSADRRGNYVPQSWKAVTWKRFREEITGGYGGDNLRVRKEFIAKELELVGMARAKGVEFLAGTDTPAGVYVFPGFSLHEELQRFVAAGFTPLQALQTATSNPARFFGEEERFGAVETGKAADLVLLRANPLADIANTQQIAAVVLNGRYFSRKELDALLDGVKAAAARQ
jgi:imidazolonepropionase-like amidohydrolase